VKDPAVEAIRSVEVRGLEYSRFVPSSLIEDDAMANL
jgi:hypothetical protein